MLSESAQRQTVAYTRTSRAVSCAPCSAAGDSERSASPGTISLIRLSMAAPDRLLLEDCARPASGECRRPLLLVALLDGAAPPLPLPTLLLPLTFLCTRTLR
jgi:hypothetical protein